MELVYLWVEDYKNNKKQGFNFSPRFRCEYKDGELTIDEKKDYVSIFPDNINITAIVGENGSGKSSILKTLKKILDYIPYTELGYGRSSNQVYPFNFMLVINIDNKIQYISSFDIVNSNIEKINILGHYNYYLYLADEQKPINEEFRSDELIPHRFSIDKSITAQMLTSKYISKVDFELTTFMYLPTKIEIKLVKLHQLFADLTSDYEQGFGVSIDFDENMTDKQEDRAIRDVRNQSWAKKDDLNNIFSDAEDDFHRFLIIWYIKEYGDEEENKLESKDLLLKEYNELHELITQEEFEKYFKEGIKEIDKFKQVEKDIYFKYYNDFFEIDFIDEKDRRFNDLSHGEQTIFSQFLNIYYFALHDKDKIFLFLMDEPDLSLHPQWQKNNFFELYRLLNKINMVYHVLITTHSPFILSDIPKENVIFLENDENGNCKNVSDTIDIEQTFGANIHTLLSHGFFMKDGLMGEFAKTKINDVIKYLDPNNQEETKIKTDEDAKNIINIIGEPILKNTLLNMYEEKVYKDESKLEKLKRKQQEIEEAIKEEVKKDKLNEKS